jgi:exopolyphosphatase/guanosine-5'-triphosphate,3'-diphosphate pyrophosphatase
MIEGPGRKKPVVTPSKGAPAETTQSPAPSAATTAEAAQEVTPRSREAARRTLEKLGQKVSMKPAPEVAVVDRAGKTAALRLDGANLGRAFAAIDLGSSSAKMLVQRVGVDGRLRTVLDVKIGAGLGKGVENGKDIPVENQKRALDALKSFLADAEKLGVVAADIPMITTAVVRNSPNGKAFLDEIHALGLVRAKTLSGDEEASMGFQGALAMMNGAPGRYATLDLGGGSFQLAVGTEKGMDDGGSAQVGSNIILDSMIMPRARPDGACDASVLALVDAELDRIAPMPLDTHLLQGRTLVATGGVSKFLRAHFGKDVVTRAEIEALRTQVVQMAFADRVALVQGTKDEATRKALGVETPEGALDYGKKLPASSSLLLHILDGIGVDEVRVSETDARHALVQQRMAEAK